MGIVDDLDARVNDEATALESEADALDRVAEAVENSYDLRFAKSFAVRGKTASDAFADAADILANYEDVTVIGVGTYAHDDGFDLYITVE